MIIVRRQGEDIEVVTGRIRLEVALQQSGVAEVELDGKKITIVKIESGKLVEKPLVAH